MRPGRPEPTDPPPEVGANDATLAESPLAATMRSPVGEPTLDLTAAAAAGAADDELASAWRATFAEACREHDIHGRLDGPADGMTVAFDGQEGAASPLILAAFVDELGKRGVRGGPVLVARAALDSAQRRRASAALAHAIGRLRTLLVEYNSYLSGGLPWVFTDPGQPAAARGLAIYRFPARAAVDVEADGDAVRIHVHAGDLGEVTSSGFWVPTLLRGDLDIRIRYRLPRWQPGAAASNFALFLQDEPSEQRYYAQRRAAGDGTHEVLGNFHNDSFTRTVAVHGAAGGLRLTRSGGQVTAWHRTPDADWIELGSRDDGDPRDVLPGVKIWSSGACGALIAELHDLQLRATLPPENAQLAAVPIRPDPRHG